MKAITILQPWASLIACGAKKIETRSWPTKYRGKIAIHAGIKQIPKDYYGLRDLFPPAIGFWYGRVIAIADLVDCVLMQGNWIGIESGKTIQKVRLANGDVVTGNEILFGDYSIGRYAWILDNIQPIKPVPAKGMQRIWEWAGEPHDR